MKRKAAIITADDFGLWPEVNDAVLAGCDAGIVTSAALRVSAPAADAAMVAAAARSDLDVGLQLVLCDGRATLPHRHIPNLVDRSGRFPDSPLEAAWLYRRRAGLRDELKAEIRAQLEKFLAAGLFLSFVSSHHHLHLHPTIVEILEELACDYPISAIRKPCGKLLRWTVPLSHSPLQRAVERVAMRPVLAWGRLRSRRFAGPDRVEPLALERPVTESGVAGRLRRLRPGVTELVCHPGSLAPRYDGPGEAAVVVSELVRDAIDAAKIELISYRDLAEGRVPD